MSLRVEGFADVTPLAGGGFGSVYRAVRSSTGGTVAMKVLDRAHGDDEDLLERRLRREISALVALKGHPNVVQVEEVVSTANGPAIVMEFMAKGSVLDVEPAGSSTPARVAFIGAATAAGLQAGHDVGIVHRDVKPQNILVNAFGQVKLCDFGIAALLRADEFQTRTTALSVRYASPEELDGAPDVGSPTDVYSLGASMFHLLYGQPPSFRGGRGADPALTRSERGRDATVDRLTMLIDRCLVEDPDDRPTAQECADVLNGVGGGGRVPLHAPSADDAPVEDDITAERPDRTDDSGAVPAPEPDVSDRSDPGVRKRLPPTSNERWWT